MTSNQSFKALRNKEAASLRHWRKIKRHLMGPDSGKGKGTIMVMKRYG